MTAVGISAFGFSTPLGSDYEAVSISLREGRTGIREILKYDTTSFKSSYGGVPKEGNDAIRWPARTANMIGDVFYTDRAIDRLKRHPAFPANEYRAERIGCFVGADEPVADIQRALEFVERQCKPEKSERPSDAERAHFRPGNLLNYDPTIILKRVARALPFSGPAAIHAGLCAASLQAIGMGYLSVLRGRIDAAIVGGVSAKLTPEHFAGLEAVDVICTDERIAPPLRSRPFDTRRSGYVPAEGAVLFLLERVDRIKARGAECLLEIAGYGSSLGASHVVAPHPDSREMTLAMRRALSSAGLEPSEIDLVNAHGTSTVLNDIHEAKAIRDTLPSDVMVTANKSLHGHLIAAAGAMETLNTLIGCREGFIPGTLNLELQDPRCPLNLVTSTVHSRPRHVLKNSFGMGGLASSMIFRSCHL